MILGTERLQLRKLSVGDAGFIFQLLNEPSFIQNIGDKGVRTLDDARSYIQNGPMASYQKLGFGLWLVETKDSAELVGICGLLKRDQLEDIDLGYALLPEFSGKGYAVESASGVVEFAKTLGFSRVVAIVNPDNERSIRVLEKIGFGFERMIQISEGDPELKLFASNF
ncbi:MAG: GNAT family N-acetyltransferase [Acidobacteria bacterium]|nr:GNAT family N-acetyltransferase [Acidobacteriota bacterium]